MAAELVGGAILSAFLQVAFDRLVSPKVLDYFQKRRLNETLLEKLNIMLLSLNTVVDDAEERQFSDPRVKAWLDKVKDAVYDAEDVLDEIDYEVSKHKLEAEIQTTITCKVRNFFSASVSSFDKEIESRMKQILENLEFLESKRIVLGLKEGSRGSGESLRKLPTTSLVDEARIYGRDDDKEIIIEWLLNDNHFSIISVVGMGGLGKTALAQLVYNDQRVKDEFDIKVWVCVSDDFDVLRVTRTIFKAFSMSNNDTEDLDMLQTKLKEMLTAKKFLIVCDDIWNEDYILWEAFQTPFIYGTAGCRILATTRSDKVALAMHSDEIHHLRQLSKEDSWLLFTKYAFHNAYPQRNLGLEEIGKRIIKKCKGLPLALKTIGSLLYTKLSCEEWNSILTSEIWNISDDHNNILPALRLSYHYLTSHLKRCFAYCSIFPKDYEFNKEQLVLLWMAQDFLQDSQLNKSIEEVGNQYFQDLVSMSFFQKSTMDDTSFVMHDLLNDLANFVSGEFCLRLEFTQMLLISKKTRHLSFSTFQDGKSKQFEDLNKTKKLRTFLPFSSFNYFHELYWMSSDMILDQLSNCKCLRVLSLSYYFNIMELPNSIGNLIHLRYLNLSGSRVKRLPNSTCLLYKLQTLKLANCKHLEELPSDLHRLSNLRYLDLQKTKLKKIPQLMGKLKNLQVLTSFYVGKCCESNIKQLAELNLRGKLCILELQNVVHGMDASTASLKDKKYLEELRVKWSKNNNESQNERDVLEKLKPHQNLKKLSVMYYGGTRFPDWFADNTLSNLVSLKLKNCRYCIFLPSLGNLPSLKSLLIEGLEGIVAIGAEFLGKNSTTSFGSLEILKFKEMVNWEEWECKTTTRAFPCIKELHIKNCPMLKKHLPKQLPSLEILCIVNCQQLVALVPWAPVIHSLTLRNCGKVQLEYVPSILKALRFAGPCMDVTLLEKIEHTIADTCIEKLNIHDCLNLEFPLHQCHNSLLSIRMDNVSLRTFPLNLFPKLQSLELLRCSNLKMISISEECKHDPMCLMIVDIRECPKFVSFPKGGFSAPRLEWCVVAHLESMKSLPKHMNILFPSLKYLTIINCPQMESFPEGGLPSNLTHLHILECPNLFASQKEWGLHSLNSLDHLIIGGADVVESLPEPGLLPPTLISLCFCECSNLTMLDYKGLCHLSSLKRLILVDCPRLQCLPKEGLPSSLSYLEIRGNCPLLKQQCQKLKGEDWGKIAHIPCIMIDDDIISRVNEGQVQQLLHCLASNQTPMPTKEALQLFRSTLHVKGL